MSAGQKVSLAKCSSYAGDLRSSLQTLLLPLGGMEAFVKPGQSVLIKPNLLSDRAPDEAVTTHPEIARAIVRLVTTAGGKPQVGDSPTNVMKIEKVWETTGFSKMCSEEHVPLVNMDKAGSERFTVDGISFSISRTVLDADVVINVPKVKTHVLTILTAAVKNTYGTVPGFQKTILHKTFPTASQFGSLIAKVYRAVRPALNIADAVVGMEGDGPSAGTPTPLGFLAASADAAALDLVLCGILGIEPRTVPYLRPFLAIGGKMPGIETVGASPGDVAPRHFRVPSTLLSRAIPGPLVRMLDRWLWIRPSFSRRCVACGQCVKACPAQALVLEGRTRPLLRPHRCIGCCCCHEVCPARAVSMVQSPLLNFVRRGNL